MEWISIKDRLPPHMEYVLCFDGDTQICKFIQTSDKRHKKRKGYFEEPAGLDSFINEVTHWRAVPYPPLKNKEKFWEGEYVYYNNEEEKKEAIQYLDLWAKIRKRHVAKSYAINYESQDQRIDRKPILFSDGTTIPATLGHKIIFTPKGKPWNRTNPQHPNLV
ncbi:DUF551 domain-containing protein [bacterium]|nr:DUF551 domain-containing protein [bacterium]